MSLFKSLFEVEGSTIFHNIAVGISALVTAGMAFPGLKHWTRQLRRKNNLDLEAARNILRATYKIKEAVGSCRDPFLAAGEFPKDYDHQSNDPNHHARSHAHVYNNRWEHVRNARQEFDAAVLEAEILWGRDVQAKAEELRKCLQELFRALYAYVRNIESDGAHFKEDEKRKAQVEWVIGLTRKPNEQFIAEDWFEKYGDDAIAGIETFVRPHLDPK